MINSNNMEKLYQIPDDVISRRCFEVRIIERYKKISSSSNPTTEKIISPLKHSDRMEKPTKKYLFRSRIVLHMSIWIAYVRARSGDKKVLFVKEDVFCDVPWC